MSCANDKPVVELKKETQTDSVSTWINLSKKKNITIEKKKILLKNAYYKVNLQKDDSIKAQKLSDIAYQLYRLNDSVRFKKINDEAFKLASKIDYTYTIADTYWNYANYYKKKENYENSYYYFDKAYQLFESIKEHKNAGRMLYAMAYIKGQYRDYTGSEVLIFRGIKKFTALKNNKRLYIAYNYLGLLQEDIKEYDKALLYYKKALGYIQKENEYYTNYYHASLNNIALTYLKKKQYIKALKLFNQILKDKELSPKNKKRIARIIDNKAYCKLKMKDTIGVLKDMLKALAIRKKIGNKTDILTSKIHLSDYYSFSKDTLKALQLAKEANILAKQIKNGRDYLASLQQLANLDRQNAKKYLDRHIQFNDSLISIERRMRNKFTRIEFETDEYIAETKRLEQQRIWIFFTSVSSLLILSLLYFLRVQKVKNEKLRLEAEQQKANEEIYILTLEQQAKLEEEKVKERNRISEELHDGILGKLFGTRFGLGFLNISGDDETLNKHQSLLNELQEIEKEIREVSHKLSDNFDNSEISFTTIIKQLLKDKSLIGNFNYQINFDDAIPWKEINEITKVNIYRITQEAIQNIIKHAKAKNVTLAFSITSQELIIKLSDDGIGFNTKKGRKGIGLKNITSRIQRIHAHLDIHSEINVGTTFSIKIPYLPQS
ncbi:putative two-component system sensor histidine kinase [Tenacibaculum maritimum]|uniref:tetratricopeptide repeat-containing sensor histidine kinase n=1 Tax=Tenacibaculum maritimum TaxID=107401 RepID=UPI0012E4512B|nr:tetratricopeptide repeat-containing sensor histidine kinase [Tenacibaculum maritimum]CAA0242650.1 putative two-component system sensor histidine kinase [Tenacibaculum maritimum]